MNEIIQNAIIESVEINDAERGLLTCCLNLDYGGSGQGFGGFTLYLPKYFEHHKQQKNYAGHWIWRCMEIAGVSNWDKMKGKTIRVKLDRPYGSVIAIGHIIKNDWFDPKAEFEALT